MHSSVRLEHSQIHFLLLLREFPITRITTRYIRHIMMHGVPHVHQAHRVRRDDIIIGHVVQRGRVNSTSTDLVVREKLAVVILLAVGVED